MSSSDLFIFMKYLYNAIDTGIAATSFLIQFINSAMVLGFVTQILLFKQPQLHNQNHKHISPKTRAGHAKYPKQEIRCPPEQVSQGIHSLINFHSQLDFHFILRDKDPCLLEWLNLNCQMLKQ